MAQDNVVADGEGLELLEADGFYYVRLVDDPRKATASLTCAYNEEELCDSRGVPVPLNRWQVDQLEEWFEEY